MDDGNPSCSKVGVDADSVNYKTCGGTDYKSLNYHHSYSGTTHDKSIWSVSRDYECHTFCLAEMNYWSDRQGNFWSLRDGTREVLGEEGERLAFFWSKSNSSDPWHGFPVSGRKGAKSRKSPPDDLVQRWYDTGEIGLAARNRIAKGKI